MKQLNKLRATLICSEYLDGKCSTMITDVLSRFLKDIPSMIEKGVCKKKGCASKNSECRMASLEIDESTFDANLTNLEQAVSINLECLPKCRKCRNTYNNFERTPGSHLFIEVSKR